MKIAQVSALWESVPPKAYGGIERVVHALTEELVREGHDVTLFATGDSETSAKLVSTVPFALRLAPERRDPLISQVVQLGIVARRAAEFDVIHFHTELLHFPVVRDLSTPTVTTLHGRLDLPEDLADLFQEFSDAPVISISDAQRRPVPTANWVATVYNGMPEDLYDFKPRPGDYLAFLGRICPDKGPEEAIEIARRSRLPLKIAAKVDDVFGHYFRERIEPQLADPLIEYVGEVDDREKNALLGGARALLFPVNWPEPFGLAMTESLACGTPVIAFRRGSVPEIVQEGVTGFIVQTVDEAVEALSRLDTLDRHACRRDFEMRFSTRSMVSGYLSAYARVLENSTAPARVTAIATHAERPPLAIPPIQVATVETGL